MQHRIFCSFGNEFRSGAHPQLEMKSEAQPEAAVCKHWSEKEHSPGDLAAAKPSLQIWHQWGACLQNTARLKQEHPFRALCVF